MTEKNGQHTEGRLEKQVMKYPKMSAAELQSSVTELQAVSEWTIQHTVQKQLKTRVMLPP
jgi:hypothetical protein